MAYVTKHRPGGCGCRQAALNNGSLYANMNYAASNQVSSAESTWPYYNGPCPGTRPVNDCPGFCRGTNGLPCSVLSNCPCGCGTEYDDTEEDDCPFSSGAIPAHGFFSHMGALSLPAGGGIPFSGAEQSQGMHHDGTQIRVHQPGLYHIAYHLTWPCASSVNARFAVMVNAEPVSGSDVRFRNDEESHTHSVSGQAIVYLHRHAGVSLVSDCALQVAPQFSNDTIATLSLTRLT